MGTDSYMENRMIASGFGGYGVEGLSTKDRGLIDMDNSMGILVRKWLEV